MALSTSEMQKGAIVCEMFDDEMKDGRPTANYGKKLSRQRYGRISKVIGMDGSEIVFADGVRELWVEFEPGKPEKVAPARLALYKNFDQAAFEKISQSQQNAVVKGGGKGVQDALGLRHGDAEGRKMDMVNRGV